MRPAVTVSNRFSRDRSPSLCARPNTNSSTCWRLSSLCVLPLPGQLLLDTHSTINGQRLADIGPDDIGPVLLGLWPQARGTRRPSKLTRNCQFLYHSPVARRPYHDGLPNAIRPHVDLCLPPTSYALTSLIRGFKSGSKTLANGACPGSRWIGAITWTSGVSGVTDPLNNQARITVYEFSVIDKRPRLWVS